MPDKETLDISIATYPQTRKRISGEAGIEGVESNSIAAKTDWPRLISDAATRTRTALDATGLYPIDGTITLRNDLPSYGAAPNIKTSDVLSTTVFKQDFSPHLMNIDEIFVDPENV
ncbi:hypothetical protein [Frigidibacter sp. ROC022]|uniref:hypothetical protein n=1 Tax=Frigidibacter sp. ROC022 TaxID=2971796 RepID=UPI00215A9CE6|nr:hypothetical protein [Frigidibacter sp. ROC022]MCR8724530.1 hypothetical protein [Frigidibacter sp. ROC022]